MFAQFGHDFFQPLGLEDVLGFAERAERGPLTTEFALNFPQLARLLDGPQGANHGIEEEQQHKHAVLVVMQHAVAGLVALAADFMQACQQGSELVEILQARHVLFAHLFAHLPGHGDDYARLEKPRNTTNAGCDRMRKSRAEQDWF